jgi:hypothetical protein
MTPLFILIAVPLGCQRLGDWATSRSQPSIRPWRHFPLLNNFLNVAIVLAMAVFAGVHTAQIIQRQPQVEMQLFPSRAVAFLRSHPADRMFNHYDWGGYLIWKLYPSTRVFIDGRADLYGRQLLDQFANTYQFRGDWQQALQQWKITTVLVPADSALATGLQNSSGWAVTYEDSQAVILSATHRAIPTEAAALLPWECKKLPLPEHFAGYYEVDHCRRGMFAAH